MVKMGRSTYLHAAYEVEIDLILVNIFPFPVLAGPAPNVLRVAVVSAMGENSSANGPHDDAEGEEGDGEESVIDCRLFSPSMAPSEVGPEDA